MQHEMQHEICKIKKTPAGVSSSFCTEVQPHRLWEMWLRAIGISAIRS